MPNIDINLNESCYTTQQRDQLQRLIMKKQDLELIKQSMENQISQLTQAFTQMGVTLDTIKNIQHSKIKQVSLNLVGVSVFITDIEYAKQYIMDERENINHQIITLKKNLQTTRKELWEIDSKIVDIYNQAHGTDISFSKSVSEKRKQIYQQAEEEINNEVGKLEKQLMEELTNGD